MSEWSDKLIAMLANSQSDRPLNPNLSTSFPTRPEGNVINSLDYILLQKLLQNRDVQYNRDALGTNRIEMSPDKSQWLPAAPGPWESYGIKSLQDIKPKSGGR